MSGEEDDLPPGIRYDPDLAVHEPMAATSEPIVPGRRRSPLLLFGAGILGLCLVSYLLFGLIARETRTSSDYLDAVRIGGVEAWRAAYELSRMLPDEDKRHRDPVLAERIVRLLSGPEGQDVRLRRYLVLSLGEIKDAAASETLLAALGDGDPETRIYAAWGLANLGDRRAPAAIAPLLDDSDSGVRKMAAYALGALGDPVSAAALRAAINDPADEVAWNAALALARLGDRAAGPLLSRMLDRGYLSTRTRPDDLGQPRPLDEDRKEEVLLNALKAAPLLGEGAPLNAMKKLRDSDPSPRVRQAAFEALRAIESPPKTIPQP